MGGTIREINRVRAFNSETKKTVAHTGAWASQSGASTLGVFSTSMSSPCIKGAGRRLHNRVPFLRLVLIHMARDLQYHGDIKLASDGVE